MHLPLWVFTGLCLPAFKEGCLHQGLIASVFAWGVLSNALPLIRCITSKASITATLGFPFLYQNYLPARLHCCFSWEFNSLRICLPGLLEVLHSASLPIVLLIHLIQTGLYWLNMIF